MRINIQDGLLYVDTCGTLPEVGGTAPKLNYLVKINWNQLNSLDISNKIVVLNIFPSIDLLNCDKTIKRFNEEAKKFNNAHFIGVSTDLPGALRRFCESEKIQNMTLVSAYLDDCTFGHDFGVKITEVKKTGEGNAQPFKNLFAKAVVVLDQYSKVIYADFVKDFDSEPNYEACLEAIAVRIQKTGLIFSNKTNSNCNIPRFSRQLSQRENTGLTFNLTEKLKLNKHPHIKELIFQTQKLQPRNEITTKGAEDSLRFTYIIQPSNHIWKKITIQNNVITLYYRVLRGKESKEKDEAIFNTFPKKYATSLIFDTNLEHKGLHKYDPQTLTTFQMASILEREGVEGFEYTFLHHHIKIAPSFDISMLSSIFSDFRSLEPQCANAGQYKNGEYIFLDEKEEKHLISEFLAYKSTKNSKNLKN